MVFISIFFSCKFYNNNETIAWKCFALYYADEAVRRFEKENGWNIEIIYSSSFKNISLEFKWYFLNYFDWSTTSIYC